MRMRRLVPLLALAITVSTPWRGVAAPTWTEPAPIAFYAGIEPTVAFADGGVEYTARIALDGAYDPDNVVTRLVVSRRVPGQPEVEDLVIASTPTAVPADLAFAVAPNGAAVLAFGERTSSDFSPLPPVRWRAAYRDASGTWEAPSTLFVDIDTPTPGMISERVLCAIAPDGTAVAGASHLELDDTPSEPAPGQTDARLDMALHPAGGAWQPSQRLTATNVSVYQLPVVAADDDANFSIAWNARYSEGATISENDDRRTILVRRLLAGQTSWNTAEDVTHSSPSGSAYMNGFGFAVGASGRTLLGFTEKATNQVWAAVRDDAVHPFGAPEQLVTGASSSATYATAVAPDGAAYVVYNFTGSNSGLDHVGVVKLPPGGTWTDELPISNLSFLLYGAGIAFVGADAHIVWSGSFDAPDFVVQTTRWPAGAAVPEAARDLDGLATNIVMESVQSDRAGSVVATWEYNAGRIRSVFDAGAPALASSTIPTGLVAGVPATFSSTFLDAWSALAGEPIWSFADGMSGQTGGTVEHAFPAPGDYAVTATVADVFGNAATATFPVTVAACESLAGVDAVSCRCGNGLALGVAACAGATVPVPVARKFDAACSAVAGAQSAGPGRKGRKAATKAAKTFKKAARVLAGKLGKPLEATCRDALGAVLTTAKDRATSFKSAL